MNLRERFVSEYEGLLIDTNLLVLFTVGGVNRNRIENFKRTRKYTASDYDLLLRVVSRFRTLFTVAHVLAEVSNLTDLTGQELAMARSLLKETIAILREAEMTSTRAAQNASYEKLGLVDAAIAAVAREHKCAVLTDDLDLYLTLSAEGLSVLNFAHLQARNWEIQ